MPADRNRDRNQPLKIWRLNPSNPGKCNVILASGTVGIELRMMHIYRRHIATVLGAALLACSPTSTHPDAVPSSPAPRLAIPAGPYVPGQSYFGRNGYVEYIAGNAPLIYTAPHGGSLTPAEIPDRTAAACGGSATTTTDTNTDDLVRAMQRRHFARFGNYPHIVIVHLSRKKLDANRMIDEAACGDAEAITAFNEWHEFIDAAKSAVLASSGKGWYMDMHGHGHTIQRLELGYLLSTAQINLTDAELDANAAFEDTSSIRTISKTEPISFSTLLRGASSLGTLYANNGFRSVPSSADPRPNADPYFSGGDDTRRHACGAEASAFGAVTGGNICGVQIESNFTGVRDNATNRVRFGDVTAIVLEQYLSSHSGLAIGAGTPPPPINITTRGYKVKGKAQVDVTWNGATGSSVDVFRNSVKITTPNDGALTDVLGRVSGTFVYKVCNTSTTTCSPNSAVTF